MSEGGCRRATGTHRLRATSACGPAPHTCWAPTICCHSQGSSWVVVSPATCARLSLPLPHSRSAAALPRQPASENCECDDSAGLEAGGGAAGRADLGGRRTAASKHASQAAPRVHSPGPQPPLGRLLAHPGSRPARSRCRPLHTWFHSCRPQGCSCSRCPRPRCPPPGRWPPARARLRGHEGWVVCGVHEMGAEGAALRATATAVHALATLHAVAARPRCTLPRSSPGTARRGRHPPEGFCSDSGLNWVMSTGSIRYEACTSSG